MRTEGEPRLGERIRRARRDRGMTQEALAQMVGVSRSAVAQWETDRSGQVGGNLSRIAMALGVSAGYLLDGHDSGGEGREGVHGAAELALVRLFRDCGEDDR